MRRRPVYETDHDRLEEREVMKSLSSISRLGFALMPRFYAYDATLLRNGECCAWVDAKRRYHPRSKYDTYMLSCKKVSDLRKEQWATNIQALVAVKWDDYLGVISADRFVLLNDMVAMGGREDRDDPDDVEPCFFIRPEKFKFMWRTDELPSS